MHHLCTKALLRPEPKDATEIYWLVLFTLRSFVYYFSSIYLLFYGWPLACGGDQGKSPISAFCFQCLIRLQDCLRWLSAVGAPGRQQIDPVIWICNLKNAVWFGYKTQTIIASLFGFLIKQQHKRHRQTVTTNLLRLQVTCLLDACAWICQYKTKINDFSKFKRYYRAYACRTICLAVGIDDDVQ